MWLKAPVIDGQTGSDSLAFGCRSFCRQGKRIAAAAAVAVAVAAAAEAAATVMIIVLSPFENVATKKMAANMSRRQ